MKILHISPWYPYPADNGSKLRIYNLLRGLAQRHEVTLLTFANGAAPRAPAAELEAMCRVAGVIPTRPYRPNSLHALLGLLSPAPRVIFDTYSPEMEARIRDEVQAGSYDLIVASEWSTLGYARAFNGIPAILDDLELRTLESKQQGATNVWSRFRHRLPLLKLRRYLPRALSHFGACTVVSRDEETLVRRLAGGRACIEVVPNCVNVGDYSGVERRPQPGRLIYTGSFRYSANHDAMTWFVGEVYPRIQAQVPGADLVITGDHAGLPLPPAHAVTLTGRVDDVRPLVASSCVSLAPIRLGAGTRLKILEAMALRVPVVATSKGCEGLDVQDGVHLLVADTADAFAAAVVRILQEPGLSERLSANAYRLVSSRYDWSVVMPRFLDLVEQVAGARPRSPQR